ncbi:hypothetical protein [Gluconobacter kondonii]
MEDVDDLMADLKEGFNRLRNISDY